MSSVDWYRVAAQNIAREERDRHARSMGHHGVEHRYHRDAIQQADRLQSATTDPAAGRHNK